MFLTAAVAFAASAFGVVAGSALSIWLIDRLSTPPDRKTKR